MNIEQIRQQLIDEGQNPDDYNILVMEQGYQVWKKACAPNYIRSVEQVTDYKVSPLRRAGQIATKKMIVMDELTPEELEELVDVFDDWEAGKSYRIGDVMTYQGQFYEVVQAHTSQVDWKPDTVPALFKSHAPAGTIPEWKQPTGGHDAYQIGDKVMYKTKVWTSKIDANTTVPDGDEPHNRYWEPQA